MQVGHYNVGTNSGTRIFGSIGWRKNSPTNIPFIQAQQIPVLQQKTCADQQYEIER
jgi:hypothetical protein